MKTVSLAIFLTLAVILLHAQEQQPPHWTYEGEHGPEHWGDLSPDFSACKTGREQSPINITKAEPSNLPAIQFDYQPATLKVIDNGHTVQVNYPVGSSIKVGDKTYQLVQFHFHHPSEELINGKPHDLVIHLVHQDSEGHKAVVAVLASTGPSNPTLKAVLDHIPQSKAQEVDTGAAINAADLLPSNHAYYTFPGSLTTPPCTEGVTWFVLKTPITLAPSDLALFTRLYPHNARPAQPLNGRTVRSSE